MAIAAARMLSEKADVMQSDIASRLGISQPHVSRLLKFAIAQGFLSTRPQVVREAIKPAEWDEVEQLYFSGSDLVKSLAENAPHGISFQAHICSDDDDVFFASASRLVRESLSKVSRVGVMSGQTVSRLIDSMRTSLGGRVEVRKRAIECIPLCGDPVHLLNQRAVELSASNLAGTLETILAGATRQDLPCLTGVPAYIGNRGRGDGGSRGGAWISFVQSIPGYRKIFGGEGLPTPMIHGVDAILSGVGVIGFGDPSLATTAAFIQERILQGDADLATIDQVAVGDIGGLLVPWPEASAAQLERVKELNAGWTGASWNHFASLARRAGSERVPGVIIVAAGSRKAPVVLQAIRRGVVNMLIITADLGDAIARLLEDSQSTNSTPEEALEKRQ